MKHTIIKGIDYTDWAIDGLLDEQFWSDLPIFEITKDKVDYSYWREDIEIREDGVYMPTEYTLGTDEEFMSEPKDHKYFCSINTLETEVKRLIEENEPEAYNELVNVKTDKN